MQTSKRLKSGTARATVMCAVLLCGCLCSRRGVAQAGAVDQRGFDVASVKRVDNSTLGDSVSMNIGTLQGEQITFQNAMLNDCIRFAYSIPSDVQITGPAWIKSMHFLYTITAKGPPGATNSQMRTMLQGLLAERFQLAVHTQPKTMAYFALSVSKQGSQMRSVPAVPQGFHGRTWGGQIDSIITMPTLAYLLSRFDTERPTLDETGLQGFYDVKLTWTTAAKIQGTEGDAGVPLPTALQQQLGLRLEERRGAVTTWVVDAAQQEPTEN